MSNHTIRPTSSIYVKGRRVFSEQEQEYIRNNLRAIGIRAVAKNLHASTVTIANWAEGVGIYHRKRQAPCGTSRMSPRTLYIREILLREWADHTPKELEEKYGIPRKVLINKFCKLNLDIEHSPQTLERIRQERSKSLARTCTKMHQIVKSLPPEEKARFCAKRGRTLARRIAYDRMRVMMGEKPLMKRKYSILSFAASHAKWYLSKTYDYFVPEGETDPYALYYDAQTRRRPLDTGQGSEAYYVKRYGFKFLPADEEDEEITEQ